VRFFIVQVKATYVECVALRSRSLRMLEAWQRPLRTQLAKLAEHLGALKSQISEELEGLRPRMIETNPFLSIVFNRYDTAFLRIRKG
jgi:hypothetical protein